MALSPYKIDIIQFFLAGEGRAVPRRQEPRRRQSKAATRRLIDHSLFVIALLLLTYGNVSRTAYTTPLGPFKSLRDTSLADMTALSGGRLTSHVPKG